MTVSLYSTQLNEHVRTQVLTPQCPHLFNTTIYETTHLLLHVLIYLSQKSEPPKHFATATANLHRFK